jgi:hypothetical protein
MQTMQPMISNMQLIYNEFEIVYNTKSYDLLRQSFTKIMRLPMWKYDFLSPPPYRAMLLVIELKMCSTMLTLTVNIVLKGGKDELLMVGICWFYR